MSSEVILALALVLPAAFAQTYFVYRYGRYSAWRWDRIGRALMIKSTTLALLLNAELATILLYAFAPDLAEIGDQVEMLAFLLCTIAIWWQLITLLKAQRGSHGRRVGKDRD